MLQEAFLWLTTPCSRGARRMGYLSAAIGLGARHTRCREAWRPHLQHTRDCLLRSALAAPADGCALVLGSGLLLDIPVEQLSQHFREVVLVDVVHLPEVRRRVRALANVRLLELDVTGCVEALLSYHRGATLPEPVVPVLELRDLRWVASVNLLSQLHLLPAEWLQARWPGVPEAALQAWARRLLMAHVDWVVGMGVPWCLVADIEQTTRDSSGLILEQTQLYDVLAPLGAVRETWSWPLAPRGELPGGVSSQHQVGAWWC